MKSFKAYVQTKTGLIEVQAQVNPVYPATMVYRLAPRKWHTGDIEIGMPYDGSEYSSAAKAWEGLINSDILGRADAYKKQLWVKRFQSYADTVIQKCLDDNNKTLYDYLTGLHEEDE